MNPDHYLAYYGRIDATQMINASGHARRTRMQRRELSLSLHPPRNTHHTPWLVRMWHKLVARFTLDRGGRCKPTNIISPPTPPQNRVLDAILTRCPSTAADRKQ